MVDRTSLNKTKINEFGNEDAVGCLECVISQSVDSCMVIIHTTKHA
jgi:hypothetical protein